MSPLTPIPSVSPSGGPIVPIPTPKPTYLRRDPILDGDFSDQGDWFDPYSTLTTYYSAGCGPRGHNAYADTSQCQYGVNVVKETQYAAPQLVAIIDFCQYFYFKVYECKSGMGRRSLFSLPDTEAKEFTPLSLSTLPQFEELSDLFSFNPNSTLVGYISNDCGPRGSFALADLSQCEFGHERVQYVPWKNDKVVAQVDRCDYISFEVYECSPPMIFEEDDIETIEEMVVPINLSYQMTPTDNAFLDASEVVIAHTSNEDEFPASCKVVIGNGSCLDPTPNVILGLTTETEFTVEGEFDEGNIMMVFDYHGDLSACGEIERKQNAIEEISESIGCLCGCLPGGSCNNMNNRPYSLYLKSAINDVFLTQITVYFKPKSNEKPCNVTVDVDDNGLFEVALPEHCRDRDGKGIGTEVAIDYRGDERVDVDINTACSVPLYAGMAIEDSPFVIEGYCLSKDKKSCIHNDKGQVCG